MVSTREGYSIDLVKGDMSKTFPFEDETFDMIFNPVSNCYIQDVEHVWQECFRVLKRWRSAIWLCKSCSLFIWRR